MDGLRRALLESNLLEPLLLTILYVSLTASLVAFPIHRPQPQRVRMKARTSASCASGASELPERCALTPKKQGGMAQPPTRTLSSNTLACVNWVIDRVALGSDSPGDGAGGEGGGGPPVVNSFNPKTSFGDDQQFIIADFVEDPSKPCLFIWWDPEDTTDGSKCLDKDVALNTMFESDPLFLPSRSLDGFSVQPGPLHVALQMLGRPVTEVMYFSRPQGALVSLNEKNMGSFIQYGSVNTGEIDSLRRSMTRVFGFVPLLTQ